MTDHSEHLARISHLETKLEQAEAALEQAQNAGSGFWAVKDWKDGLKVLSVLSALLLFPYTFYRDYWLPHVGRDAATRERMEAAMEELSKYDLASYDRLGEGDLAGADRHAAAFVGRRERLAIQLHDHWQRQPDFFSDAELMQVGHHLLLQGHTRDAIEMARMLEARAEDVEERANAALFLGRTFGASGDGQDLEAAREALRRSAGYIPDMPNDTLANRHFEQVLYYRLFMELWNDQPCDRMEGLVPPLRDVLDALPPDDTLSIFSGGSGAQMLATYEARCGAA